MSADSSPELKSLFETALTEFEKRAGTNLLQHQVIETLANCESADSVIDFLQQQAQLSNKISGEDSILIKWLKRTVHVLHALSTNDIIREHITLVRLIPSHMQLSDNVFSSAFPTSESHLRRTRHTSYRMCFT